jgi:hypothetical protein
MCRDRIMAKGVNGPERTFVTSMANCSFEPKVHDAATVTKVR